MDCRISVRCLPESLRMVLFGLVIMAGCEVALFAKDIQAGPGDYGGKLRSLKPGDRLILKPGIYKGGLRLQNLNGNSGKPITITGIPRGRPALFEARRNHNTVEINGCSFLTLSSITIDGKNMGSCFGIDGNGNSHDITIENCILKNHAAAQSTVAISTTGSAVWNWTIRNNVIENAGTGMYLGNSDGSNPFVGGIIENNLFKNTIGYNVQIKHQNNRPSIPGMPARAKTIIRHNVFSNVRRPPGKSDGRRPCLLVGTFPTSGKGADDMYLIYGNFFYENCSGEALFQGEGNIAFYNNVLVNSSGDGFRVHKHNGVVRKIRVFHNTVIAKGTGISVRNGDKRYKQLVFRNAVFAGSPIKSGGASGNITSSFNSASSFLVSPNGGPGTMNLYPRPGKLRSKVSFTSAREFPDWNTDFNGHPRRGIFAGAYEGAGANRGWRLQLERKPAGKRFEGVATDGEYKHLKSLAANIENSKRLGYTLRSLRTRIKDKNPEIAGEAKKLFEILQPHAEQLMKAAEELKKENPLDACLKYDEIAKMFRGDPIGSKASREMYALRSDPRVKAEKSARHVWKQIQAYSARFEPVNGNRDPSSADFRKKNVKAIHVLVNQCRKLIQKYPSTSVASMAKAMIKSYTK